jgi:hypothetical protein
MSLQPLSRYRPGQYGVDNIKGEASALTTNGGSKRYLPEALLRERSSCTAMAIDGLGVDQVDRTFCGQQRGDEQAMGGFDVTGHLLFLLWSTDGEQKVFQVCQSFHALYLTTRSYLMRWINRAVLYVVGSLNSM